MKKTRSPGAVMTGQETIAGLVYLAFQLIFLPSILHAVNGMFSRPLSTAELNFVFYLINFMAMLLLFPSYLSRSATQVTQHPLLLCEAVILGFVAYYTCFHLTDRLISLLVPGFSNYNDASIADMMGQNRFLMFIGTVILVPPFEECIFRGLIFRNLHGKSPLAAYAVSILAFAMIHIVGFWGTYSPLEILMACLQYLPAGFCLAWSYVRGETIFAPILIHAAVNYITINGWR